MFLELLNPSERGGEPGEDQRKTRESTEPWAIPFITGSLWPVRALAAVAKLALVFVSLIVLASIGGAAAPAAPFLIPLLWFAARHSSLAGRWLFALLAGGIAFGAMWIAMYSVAGGNVSKLTWVPVIAAFVATTGWIGIWATPPTQASPPSARPED